MCGKNTIRFRKKRCKLFISKQIENRFKTLEKRYKATKDNNQASGRGRTIFEYKRLCCVIYNAYN